MLVVWLLLMSVTMLARGLVSRYWAGRVVGPRRGMVVRLARRLVLVPACPVGPSAWAVILSLFARSSVIGRPLRGRWPVASAVVVWCSVVIPLHLVASWWVWPALSPPRHVEVPRSGDLYSVRAVPASSGGVSKLVVGRSPGLAVGAPVPVRPLVSALASLPSVVIVLGPVAGARL